MSRRKKRRGGLQSSDKKMDSVYLPSLKTLIDALFQEAHDRKMRWSILAARSGLAITTVKKLGRYETSYPQFRTVELIAHALGGKVEFNTRANKKKRITWTPKVFDGRAA